MSIPVPTLVDEALFEAVQEQLQENQQRARIGQRGARYLLQGLLVCACCGYANSGKPISPSARKGNPRRYAYYRCIGSDASRFGGVRLCWNRHPRKNRSWIKDRYWKTDKTRKWIFRDQEGHTLRNHSDTAIRRHVKVKGNASPYDGNFLYWSQRLRQHPMLYGKLARLLQKQQGKCRWCELTFRHGDRVEIDHITPKNQGGGDELSNLMALHRHCHDQRHARDAEILVLLFLAWRFVGRRIRQRIRQERREARRRARIAALR